jgi:amino acid transporter
MSAIEASEAAEWQPLERNAVGLVPVLFQSVTTIAPAGGAASGLLFATTYAGGSTPLTIVLALVACGLVAVSIGQLSRHLPTAGGLYTYNTHGLGSGIGFLVGWGLIMAYAFIPALYWGFLGMLVTNELKGAASGTPTWMWAVFGSIAAALIAVLVYRGVGISTRAGVVLGVIEMVIFIALAITLIVKAGGHNTISVFGTHVGNKNGFGSVFAGMIYTVLAFIGFEAAAPIAEESKNPRRNIPIAVVGAAVGVGLFYLLVYYAATVYFGPHKMADFIGFNNGDPFRGFGNAVWGGAGLIVLLAVLNSIMACNNGATNAASRMGYALGRIGIFPRGLARVHPRFRTPSAAIAILMVVTLGLALILGFVTSGPLDVFAILGTALTVVFIPIYILTALSSTVYYWRERRSEFHLVLHVVVPVLAAAIFIPVEIASFGVDFAGLGIAPVTGVARYGLWIGGGWMLVGAAYLAYLWSSDRARVNRLGVVFTGEEEQEALHDPEPSSTGIVGA